MSTQQAKFSKIHSVKNDPLIVKVILINEALPAVGFALRKVDFSDIIKSPDWSSPPTPVKSFESNIIIIGQ